MSFDSALFEHIESSPSRTVSAAQAALHLGNQPVPQVRRKLIQLAEAAGGSIQSPANSPASTLVFAFPPDWRQRLNRRFWTTKFKSFLYEASKVGFKVLRIAFGISLILSILILLISILLIIFKVKSDQKSSTSSRSSSSSSSNSHSGGSDGFSRFGSSVGLRWTARDWLWFMYWNDQTRYYYQPVAIPVVPEAAPVNPGPPLPPQSSSSSTNAASNDSSVGPELSFFEAIFSFVFGDSNPNVNFANEETTRVGKLIRASGGSIVSDQLVPYVDEALLSEEDDHADERFMLPILEYYNGEPRVWDDALVYFFPELIVLSDSSGHKHASNSADILMVDDDKITPLSHPQLEKEWIFSRASSMQINMALFLGMVNIFELITFGSLLKEHWGLLHSEMPVTASLMWLTFIALCLYAACFVFVPVIRWILLTYYVNPRIRARNDARTAAFEQAKKKLRSDALTLRRLRCSKEACSRLVMERFGEDAVAVIEATT